MVNILAFVNEPPWHIKAVIIAKRHPPTLPLVVAPAESFPSLCSAPDVSCTSAVDAPFLSLSCERPSRQAVYHLRMLLHDDTFRRLCRARDLLASEFDGRVLLARAAQEACLSEFHFHRLFRATFGETPHAFTTRLRMDRAKQMLASGRTATEVCFAVGYESLGSFSTKFRTQFGYSPAAFQREVRRVFGYSAPWRILMVPECFLQAWAIAE